MAGADDVVKAALKLIAGGAKEAGPSVAERAAKNIDVFNTANRLGVDTNDIAKLQETKRLMDYHKGFMGDVRERAQSLAELQRQMQEQGAFPMEVGTRFTTPHSQKFGHPPHIVTGYYVDPKNPSGRYGYRVRQEHADGNVTEQMLMIRDPKLEALHGPEKWEELQRGFIPMTGPKVVKASGGSIREGYGPGGWVDDVVKMAGKVISGEGEDAAKAGIRAYQGSPHNFAAERLVRFPTGKEEYLVGQPDVLPDVPEGAEVVQDFPLGRMRMDKIGTGEGAQAYGHGLYYAEHEPVAAGYRRSLAGPESMGTVTFDGKTLIDQGRPAEGWYDPSLGISDDLHARDLSVELLKHKGDIPSAVTAFRKKAEEDLYLANNVQNENYRQRAAKSAKAYSDFADFLEANPNRYGVKIPGSMYEVRINADPDAFLDWDKPLSEQPEAVRSALTSFGVIKNIDKMKSRIEMLRQAGQNDAANEIEASLPHYEKMLSQTGDELHQRMFHEARRELGGQGGAGAYQAQVAEKFREAGIPGIKYLDAGSRGAGDGTRNYVVFDDKLISIIRKYGIAGASAMLGYNLMEQLDPKQALAASMADQDYQASRPQRSMGGNNSISGALNVARGLNGVK